MSAAGGLPFPPRLAVSYARPCCYRLAVARQAWPSRDFVTAAWGQRASGREMGALYLVFAGFALLGTANAVHQFHPNEYSATNGCPSFNHGLTSWITESIAAGIPLLPQSTSFEEFVREVKGALDAHPLQSHPLDSLFADDSPIHPTCAGQWLEFGVFSGGTVNLAAAAKAKRCGIKCPPVFGFDTFIGLPEAWARDDHSGFGEHTFSMDGKKPEVLANVELIEGLFSTSLPQFLKEQAKFTGANQTVSYLHIDCDLYAGTREAFTHLDAAIRPGTILMFDELVNYAKFRDHEIKAFWEWLQSSHARVLPLGIKGPLPGKDFSVDIDIVEGEHPQEFQAAGFVVATYPNTKGESARFLTSSRKRGNVNSHKAQ